MPQHRERCQVAMWKVLNDPSQDEAKRFRAALALATFDPPNGVDDDRWIPHADFIGNQLVDTVITQAGSYKPLVESLRPARIVLMTPLHNLFVDESPDQTRRRLATGVLIDYFRDEADVLATLISDADPNQFEQLLAIVETHQSRVVNRLNALISTTLDEADSEVDRERLARRQANAAAVLLRLGKAETVWPAFKHSPDLRARTYLVHLVGALDVPAGPLVSRLPVELDAGARRALLQTLGELNETQIDDEQRSAAIEKAQRLFLEDPDAGVHSSAEWLLRTWGQETWLADAERQLASRSASKDRRWRFVSEGFTFAVVDGRSDVKVGRLFEMATKEVSRRQIERFDPKQRFNETDHPTLDCPAGVVSWHQAVRYCQWLNEQEKIPRSEWCYPPIDEIDESNKPMLADFTKSGYRLPTQAEFELATMAGANTTWFFGENAKLLRHYAWYHVNANKRSWPGGRLKPNDLGLFDLHGNQAEWRADISPWNDSRVLIGGGTYGNFEESGMLASKSGTTVPDPRFNSYGFRVGRTVPMGEP